MPNQNRLAKSNICGSDEAINLDAGLPKLLTPSDVRKYLHIGNDLLYDLLKREDFPSIRLGKSWYILENEFCKWMVSQSRVRKRI